MGDSLGRLKIFSYPSQPKVQILFYTRQFTQKLTSVTLLDCLCQALYNDHSGHRNVACVRFLFDDTRVLSIGGRDSSVIQWTVEKVT